MSIVQKISAPAMAPENPDAGPLVVDGLEGLRGAVGAVLGPTNWVLIDQQRIDGFAEVTGDHQWIHVDVERAKSSPFGATIAHGYLTLALCNLFLPQLINVSERLHGGELRCRPRPVPGSGAGGVARAW